MKVIYLRVIFANNKFMCTCCAKRHCRIAKMRSNEWVECDGRWWRGRISDHIYSQSLLLLLYNGVCRWQNTHSLCNNWFLIDFIRNCVSTQSNWIWCCWRTLSCDRWWSSLLMISWINSAQCCQKKTKTCCLLLLSARSTNARMVVNLWYVQWRSVNFLA